MSKCLCKIHALPFIQTSLFCLCLVCVSVSMKFICLRSFTAHTVLFIPQGTQAQQKLGSWEYIYLLSTKTFKMTLLHTSLTLKKTL